MWVCLVIHFIHNNLLATINIIYTNTYDVNIHINKSHSMYEHNLTWLQCPKGDEWDMQGEVTSSQTSHLPFTALINVCVCACVRACVRLCVSKRESEMSVEFNSWAL